jgi:hypothetical protein
MHAYLISIGLAKDLADGVTGAETQEEWLGLWQ